jgi:GlpG protein
MRLIGTLQDRHQAERLAAFLLTENIATQIEQEGDTWELWVRDEDDVPRGAEEFALFLANPQAEKYRRSLEKAETLTRHQQRQRSEHRKNVVDMRRRWQGPLRPAPMSFLILGVCIAVSVATNWGKNTSGSAYRALAFNAMSLEEVQRRGLDPNDFDNPRVRCASLRSGEAWRLVTPSLLHFGILHLLFNGIVTLQLGPQIERRYGAWWLVLLSLWCAVPSNFCQGVFPLVLGGSPSGIENGFLISRFGGWSGVLFGWAGFIWMRAWFDPKSGLRISQQLIILLLVLLVIGFSGMDKHLLGEGTRLGNWAHAMGLAAGMSLGYWPKLWRDIRGTSSKSKSGGNQA